MGESRNLNYPDPLLKYQMAVEQTKMKSDAAIIKAVIQRPEKI